MKWVTSSSTYSLSKKSWPILYCYFLHKMSQVFFGIYHYLGISRVSGPAAKPDIGKKSDTEFDFQPKMVIPPNFWQD